jgi:hypothetical protein
MPLSSKARGDRWITSSLEIVVANTGEVAVMESSPVDRKAIEPGLPLIEIVFTGDPKPSAGMGSDA